MHGKIIPNVIYNVVVAKIIMVRLIAIAFFGAVAENIAVPLVCTKLLRSPPGLIKFQSLISPHQKAGLKYLITQLLKKNSWMKIHDRVI